MTGYMTIMCNSCHSITDLEKRELGKNVITLITLNNIQPDLCLCFSITNTNNLPSTVYVGYINLNVFIIPKFFWISNLADTII